VRLPRISWPLLSLVALVLIATVVIAFRVTSKSYQLRVEWQSGKVELMPPAGISPRE
jgi:hypothetical protein